LNKFFKSLSDETRRSILMLLRSGEHTVSEIVAQFHLSQPTISRHLAVLKEAELVDDQRRGQHVLYSLNPDALAEFVEDFFGEFEEFRGSFS
jgi:DNA-binding transcriptional ArsR family regulator